MEKTFVTHWQLPSDSLWPYLNITALQEQFFRRLESMERNQHFASTHR